MKTHSISNKKERMSDPSCKHNRNMLYIYTYIYTTHIYAHIIITSNEKHRQAYRRPHVTCEIHMSYPSVALHPHKLLQNRHIKAFFFKLRICTLKSL